MPTPVCASCDRPIPTDEVAQQVQLWFTHARHSGRAVVCMSCRAMLSNRAWLRRRGSRLYLQPGAMDDPVPCVTCGWSVILPTDKRRKVNACSDACRQRYYEAQKTSVDRAVTDCAECGKPAPTGRSDRAYCSNACRQRAYRRRNPSTNAQCAQYL